MGRNNSTIYVNFKDMDCNNTCIMKCGKIKRVLDKSYITRMIINDKVAQTISIHEKEQFFFDRFYYGGYLTGMDVYKYIVLFPNGTKMVIRNVSVNDPYYEELQALSKYRTKIILKDDEVYPDFPKPTDTVFVDPDRKKRF